MSIDLSEAGLEAIIVRDLIDRGYHAGAPHAYDREFCVDLDQLTAFLKATQPDTADALHLATDNPTRRKFLARLSGELEKRGVVDVLRGGIRHGAHDLTLYYHSPSPGNDSAAALHAHNRFSVTRQLRYSRDETRRALDLGLFVNGLPVATFELKNSLTKQTVADAVAQYRRDRDPREPLFRFPRCAVHFAVDDAEVRMCTRLTGKSSWFLPFNQGKHDGPGNPVNPAGLATAYLWQNVLAPVSLADILENYAQVTEEKDRKTGKKTRTQVFPRYHQLDVVRRLLADVADHGAGKRYLIQHSAGSGKSNSIAWLAHQLVGLRHDGAELFDSVLVITDRRILDKQIDATIRRFMQVGATVGHARKSGDLRTHLAAGKKIIISTVQKFPWILDELQKEAGGKRFALLIDEAHSSQGGKSTAAVSAALGGDRSDENAEDAADVADGEGAHDPEDTINAALEARMKSRKLLDNVSYFAFTATPKNKTLEMFGIPEPVQPDGTRPFRPFHGYTMKQAIGEGFILDVLRHYTPVDSYYRLVKTVEDDPEFDTKRAKKKLRRYVESHDHAIRLKAEIMVDHFHEQVIAKQKIGGQARAMVVCGSIERAIQYYHAIRTYLAQRKSPCTALVAFSGEPEYEGQKVTEASLNGFPSNDIADRFRSDEYHHRFLVVADKFQTGYDEPLLHTMYVDKTLSGIKAVQTLSRLNRAHPAKHDAFVLDFQNDAEQIQNSFTPYYRTTLLSDETDANKLHDLQHDLDAAEVYLHDDLDAAVKAFLESATREALDPVLDLCRDRYLQNLDEDGQVDFKGKAKAFVRTYDFLASILPYVNAEWEKRSILLSALVGKLPAPVEEDLAAGIYESIDMDSYVAEKRATFAIVLPDDEDAIDPVPVSAGGAKPEPELDRLSSIIASFNEQFGTEFSDSDRVIRLIRDDLAPKVQADPAYANALANTPGAAALELERAMQRAVGPLFMDHTEFYKQFMENEGFKRFVTEAVKKLAAS